MKSSHPNISKRLWPGILGTVRRKTGGNKYPRFKRKAFAATAASVALICSLSVGVLAASDTDIHQAAGEAVRQIAMVFKNVMKEAVHAL